MSGRTWVCADHHFGHRNILTFKDSNDNLIRGAKFKDIEEHDQYLIYAHNELVNPQDRVYMLGDVVINRKALWMIGQLKGRLVLVKGNHDIFQLKDYFPYFDDIRAYVVQKNSDGNKVILSHIPIHSDSLGRFGTNIHGHYHQNKIPDERYKCVSLEHTEYKPIEIYQALKL
jgi:calcineurin-like phosphoesterase family protein